MAIEIATETVSFTSYDYEMVIFHSYVSVYRRAFLFNTPTEYIMYLYNYSERGGYDKSTIHTYAYIYIYISTSHIMATCSHNSLSLYSYTYVYIYIHIYVSVCGRA